MLKISTICVLDAMYVKGMHYVRDKYLVNGRQREGEGRERDIYEWSNF